MIKKIVKSNYIKYLVLFLISFTAIEVIFRVIESLSLKDWALLRIVLGILVLSNIFALIASLLPEKIAKFFSVLIVFAFSLYAVLQMGFGSFIGVYMSFNTSSQLGAVKDYIADFIAAFEKRYYFDFLPVLFAIIYVIFMFKKDNNDLNFKLKSKKRLTNLATVTACAVIVAVLSVLYGKSLTVSFMQNKFQTISNKELFRNPSVPSIAVQNFGIITYCLDDIKTLVVDVEETETYYNTNKKNEVTPVTEEEKDMKRYFDDTDWNEIISEEKDKRMNSISNFLINNNSSDKNDYTGLFKDKNIIFILVESAGNMMIDPVYYPNLYKMYSEGLSFENNYSPRNSCSTMNNEFSLMTSLYSIYNNCTANTYKRNTYSSSIFNIFRNSGYKTVSMHDYTDAYYARNVIHKNMGSEHYYGVQKLGIKWQNEYVNWASDEDFGEAAMKILLDSGEYEDQPFMLWMTTVSGHQPYTASSITGDTYQSLFKDTGYKLELRRYMSKLKYSDNMLGIIMDRLEAAGKLDDTVFVITGDHYPYGIPLSTLKVAFDYPLVDYENERTPLVIYNSKLVEENKNQKFEQYTTYMNVLPTIANLFDLKYDPRLYMGDDALAPDYESKAVFTDGSWKNKDVYFNAKTQKIKYYTEDNEYTSDRIMSINKDITAKMNMSTSIIKNNYFNYLENKLKKKEEAREKERLAQEQALQEALSAEEGNNATSDSGISSQE